MARRLRPVGPLVSLVAAFLLPGKRPNRAVVVNCYAAAGSSMLSFVVVATRQLTDPQYASFTLRTF